MRSALVIGADAVIGGALLDYLLRKRIKASGTTRKSHSPHLELDLASDPASWPKLPRTDVTYICSAVSKLDACERSPETSRLVNVAGTSALAQKLHNTGSFVVFLSSNHVFDGTKPHRNAADTPCPINQYGIQKAETEAAVLALGNSAVLRLTKVVVPGDSRISGWHEALSSGKTVSAFDDIFLAPSTLSNVLEALVNMGERQESGLYQLSGPEDFSYFDLARAIARKLGIDENSVQRGSGAKAGVPENFRPRYSSYAPGDFPNIDVAGIDEIIAYALRT